MADVKPGEPVKKVLIQGRLAVVLYEKVGNPEVSGRIVSVKTARRPEGMVGLIEIANDGATYFRTKGTVTVKDAAGITPSRRRNSLMSPFSRTSAGSSKSRWPGL